MDAYSGIVSVGGDGTFSEIINAMLKRKDGRKLPIGIVPNGSGNCLAGELRITDIDVAMDYIITGQAVKCDAIKCLSDYET